MSNKGPIRRSQLIAPFGVGAMVVLRDGLSVITCGLDHWFQRDGGNNSKIEIEEFKVEEWRLEKSLNVSGFRLPPDHRYARAGDDSYNLDLKIPFLRFPRWHFCPGCQLLTNVVSSHSPQKFFKCMDCEAQKKTKFLVQVPFVAVCEKGHIQDFPWREWAHKSISTLCQGKLRLRGNGEAGLAGQVVECDCGATRTLSLITETEADSTTVLTKNLDSGGKLYLCDGHQPWHGDNCKADCGNHLKGSLRSASNVYFAEVRSAIYVPATQNETVNELFEILAKPPFSSFIDALNKLGQTISAEVLRTADVTALEQYKDKDIDTAIKVRLGILPIEALNEVVEGDSPETAFRRPEFNILRDNRDEEQLLVRKANLSKFEANFRNWFSNVTLVSKLRETRALIGFSRIKNETSRTAEQLISSLWRSKPDAKNLWLPAYVVYGEGIFLELNYETLKRWESLPSVKKRIEKLTANNDLFRKSRGLPSKDLTPRFVLLHTLAHALINRLTFECGYSSASLRERIYESISDNSPMAGILIYTAAGDSEGTMGGLVRMGKEENLQALLWKVLDEARWCSADPVCMEIGEKFGQGPDSCNLAACHNCALTPETSCEHFNKFLDRGTLIGSIDDDSIGYFS